MVHWCFIEQTPNYEIEWQTNRERSLQQQKERDDSKSKKGKKDEDKTSKKRKKKSDKKKKKKKHGKKSKRSATDGNSSSSSSESSSSEDERSQQPKKERVEEPSSAPTDKPANANSIRVAMRKQEAAPVISAKPEILSHSVAPPPPPIIKDSINSSSARGKWTSAGGEEPVEGQKKRDETLMQQWNTVQPVISESEKKLLEKLKGKLKNKPPRETEEHKSVAPPSGATAADEKSKRRRSRSPKRRSRSRSMSRGRIDRDRRDRDRDRDRYRDRGERRRSRSRSRSRGRRRFSRSPIRSSRRSRSRDGRRRRSRSEERVERPVVKHSEFRPRTVPERKPEAKKEKKDTEGKPKVPKTTVTVGPGGKKLPFIGKMPVFKKQPSAATNFDPSVYTNGNFDAPPPPPPMGGPPGQMVVRHSAPTAAQIQMAMMEDAFGNAPPFHPDAGMMMDYDELMPDPVQFANLMTSCPPPPPPGDGSDGENREQEGDQSEGESGENDVLPPGIDEPETDLVARPLDSAAQSADGALPQDLADALNIIFPSEEAAEAADDSSQAATVPQTVTTIVEDEPVLSEHNLQDLAKQGIHLVSIEEAEASKSVNASEKDDTKDKESPALNGKSEPQAKALKQIEADDIPMPSSPPPAPAPAPAEEDKKCEPVTNQTDILDIPEPKESPSDSEKLRRQAELDELAMLGIDSSDMAAQCM
nr:zinc finger matrin-type protein CG9776 isoform X1 [Drosophila bipectinata]